jgi:benzoyl-CoA reductase/2-hydroxyglutaryl-CoA dehydratase subunit BcrC/BadD/HgdB
VTALAELRRHYERRGQAAAASGRVVVGLVGATVPVELVLAAGAFPLNVAPLERGPTPEADRYLERHFDDEVRALLQALLAGRLDWLDLLVIPRTSDGYLELYYTLKEIVRLGRGPRVPPLHLYDLLHGRSEANRAYGLVRTRELAARLAALTGTAPDSALRDAVAEVNRQRAAVRQLVEARRDPARGITGVEALVAIGAGRFLAPGAHAVLVDAFLAEPRASVAGRARLLVVPAVPLSDPRLHALLEGAGAVVVAEDDAWGSRAAGADVPEDAPDLLAAVFDKVFLDVPSPRVAPAAARDAWFRAELARGGLDGVVFHVPRSDTWFGWDYPRLRALAEAAGVRTLLLRDLDPGPVVEFLRQEASV